MTAGKDEKVGNYVIGGRLGEGTFGTVLKATHRIATEKVAVKVLEKKRMQQAEDIERVGREIAILKMLKHPNVVRCVCHPVCTPPTRSATRTFPPRLRRAGCGRSSTRPSASISSWSLPLVASSS
eukprot:1178237-Prymnesium_polylepis.1